jgi:phosphatidylglycerophosphate synthase
MLSRFDHLSYSGSADQRPWDARLARIVVAPLKDSGVTPNHLTTVRLLVGIAGAAAFVPGTYGWSNMAAVLVILSNFLDHTDGEFARMTGKCSRFGHIYDLASDAVVTILLFVAIGVSVDVNYDSPLPIPYVALGLIAGCAVAGVFFLRMRIEDMAGKTATQQAALRGFETEDVLYLLPLVTLSDTLTPFLAAASLGAPLFAVWVTFDYRRVLRQHAPRVAR